MTSSQAQRTVVRAVPTEDRAWLLAALADALAGGAPLLPVPPGTSPEVVDELRRVPLPESTAVLIRTSGSTGVPKTVALSAAALRASAEATDEAFGGAGQWLVALPAHLIAGLQMLARSILSGTTPVFADFPGGFDPALLLERAEELDGPRRYVSLVPMQLGRLLDLAEQDRDAARALSRFDAVLVGGQAVPLTMRRRAHELGVRLRRSYGMTETAGGCVYDGVEIGGTTVRIRGGEVQIGGPHLALGYAGDDGLTADRFIEDGGARWYRTGDAGELLGGMLTVTGRLDRVVISGGVNVSLDEVERVAGELPGWEGVVALGARDAEWGERPGLVVESGAGSRDPFEEVVGRVRAQLGAAAAPVWVVEVDEVPRLAGGKPDRGALDERLTRLRNTFREVNASDMNASGMRGEAMRREAEAQ